MNDYLCLPKPPTISWSAPMCSTCEVDLLDNYDGGCWRCPSCGTAWSGNARDGDDGELYESWAGQPAGGPEVTEAEAWRISHLKEPDRSRSLERIREYGRNRENYV